MRKIKIKDIFMPGNRIYLIIILLLLIGISVKIPQAIPLCILIYILILFIAYKRTTRLREKVVKHFNSFILKLNTDESILEFPIPSTIVTNKGEILWSNKGMENLFKGINKEKYIENIIKELDEEYDENFTAIDKEISIHDKHYRLLGNIVNISKRGSKEPVIMLYFIDRTEYYKIYRLYEDSKDCVGIIVIDNYDEANQNITDTNKPQILAIVERQLREWFAFTGGLFTKLDRNRFLIVFDRKYLKAFTDSKFEILDSVKDITFDNKMPVTLSIGIIAEDGTKAEKLNNAYSSIDIALGRGGDQAVIKKDGKYEFFGGKSKELEKRTRVKARVVAQALQELIKESKNVVIMGHKNMDADCLGAALGLYRLSKTIGKDTRIVFNNYGVGLENLLLKLGKDKEYNEVFIETSEAQNLITPESLLIVVDTHKTDYVESPELLEKTNRRVLIDHHRRSTEFIEEPTLTFHEVYASSTCELVTEILQYVDEKLEIPLIEAESLYAGILTDTKNFTFKTGVRTFEAAAYLKKLGVDVVAVKKLFQSSIDTYVAIADVIRNSEIIKTNIAIAVCPPGLQNSTQIAAQAADELLNLNEIETSFVLVELNGYINISGRSNGGMNVQVVLEKLGGGGHQTVAGAQIYEATIEEAREKLLKAIDETISVEP